LLFQPPALKKGVLPKMVRKRERSTAARPQEARKASFSTVEWTCS
jgi:hypothetical protein